MIKNIDLSPLLISLKTATVATAIAFLLGIIAARIMLGYRGTGKGAIDAIFTSPLVLPPTVVGFLLLLLLGRNGPIGKLLGLFDITIIFTWYATLIAATVVAFPLVYKTVFGAFKQIDRDLIAAAKTLGASEFRIFWEIMLPLAKPGVVSGVLLAFARALGEFGATLILAGNIPGITQTIPIAIYIAAESGQMDLALAWVIVILVISFGVIITVNAYSDSNRINLPKVRPRRNPLTKGLVKHWLKKIFAPTHPFRSDVPNFVRTYHDTSSTSSPELIVEIQKRLPGGFCLDVSFNTRDKPLGLLGASGSGKSLILKCIAGLEKPDRGKIVLNGRILFDSDRRINIPSRDRRVGFLFQNYALFPHLTVAENIAFGIRKQRSDRKIAVQLKDVGLEGMGDRYPSQLSGGQQQRAALARAIAANPEVLLLDEPFSALDTYLRDRLEKVLIASLTNYCGVTLFVTHNLEEAYRVCSNLLVVETGTISAFGKKQDIFDRPPTKAVALVSGCKNFSRAVAISSTEIKAIDWECNLKVLEPIPDRLSYVGLRAHQIVFPAEINQENTFNCWLVDTSQTQHRVTLYLKLHRPSTNPQDYHLQAEVFKEKWATFKDRPLPWPVQLHSLRLILLSR